jgi:hypothetical protein
VLHGRSGFRFHTSIPEQLHSAAVFLHNTPAHECIAGVDTQNGHVPPPIFPLPENDITVQRKSKAEYQADQGCFMKESK